MMPVNRKVPLTVKPPEYRLIRSDRRTMSLELDADGTFTVRAPYYATILEIREFVEKHRGWMNRRLEEMNTAVQKAQADGALDMKELHELADRAVIEIPRRVRHWASVIGVRYRKITIRNQKTRWGSCSSNGNLNFNCLLMLAPPEVLDSVVVHELCHLKHMNHSPAFYADVLKYFPDYEKCSQWLKDNGAVLMKRMTG